MLHLMEVIHKAIKSYGIDTISLFISFISVIAIASFILWDANLAKTIIDNIYSLVVSYFGSSYLVLTMVSFLFLIILATSNYGKYILGGKDTSPEFSYFSWIGMLFCSGIGGGIIYWSGVEWAYYFGIPQFSIEAY